MGTNPSPVNTVAQTVDEIIYGAVYGVAVNAFEAFAIYELPFLGLPGIKQLFQLIVDTIAGYIYHYFAQVVTFSIIDLQTTLEKNAYTKAEADLRLAHLSGDPHAISAATLEFKKTLASLIHFDGSTPT